MDALQMSSCIRGREILEKEHLPDGCIVQVGLHFSSLGLSILSVENDIVCVVGTKKSVAQKILLVKRIDSEYSKPFTYESF